MECGLSSIPTTQDRDCPINLRSFDDTLWGDGQPENLIYVGNSPKGGHFIKDIKIETDFNFLFKGNAVSNWPGKFVIGFDPAISQLVKALYEKCSNISVHIPWMQMR